MDFWEKARGERGVSQAAVARQMGTSQSWVARMESGTGDAGLSSVRRYLTAIGARLDVQPDPDDVRRTVAEVVPAHPVSDRARLLVEDILDRAAG